MDIQLGRSRTVRRAYGIDEIALVPGGRTVDPEVTDTRWTLGGIEREIPIIASAMDGVVDVGMAVKLSQLGACLLYTSPSPRDLSTSRMPSSA